MKNSHHSTDSLKVRSFLEKAIKNYPFPTTRSERRKTLTIIIDLIGEGLSIYNLSMLTQLAFYLLRNGATKQNAESFLMLILTNKWKLKARFSNTRKHSRTLISFLKKLFRFVKK